MQGRIQAMAIGAVLALSACQSVSTGNPTADRAAVGAAGGAVLGQALGGDTESTAAGAVLGGLAGGLTAEGQPLAPRSNRQTQAAGPCADIYERYQDPALARDLCRERLNQPTY